MRRKFRWDDENPTCAKCGVSLALRDGCEWGEDKSLVFCHDCSIKEIERLRKIVAAARKVANGATEEFYPVGVWVFVPKKDLNALKRVLMKQAV